MPGCREGFDDDHEVVPTGSATDEGRRAAGAARRFELRAPNARDVDGAIGHGDLQRRFSP
jgi:hypothetical protein